MIHRYRAGYPPSASGLAPGSEDLTTACRRAPGLIQAALAGFDFRLATAAIWAIAEAANRYINHTQPWHLAKADRSGNADAAHQLDSVLATLIQAIKTLGGNLTPFLPGTAAHITQQLVTTGGRLPQPHPLLERITIP